LLFLWFWMLFVSVVSWCNCLAWTRIMFFPRASKAKLKSFFACHEKQVYLEKFFHALGPDGIFILHQIAMNVGDLPTR